MAELAVLGGPVERGSRRTPWGGVAEGPGKLHV